MDQHKSNKQGTLTELISEYEAMSQKGTVAFYEEKVFFDFINYYKNAKAFDKALEVLEHALAQHSYSSDLLLCKAKLLVSAREIEEALNCLNKAYALAPTDEEVYLLRSEMLSALGQHEEALSMLDKLQPKVADSEHIYLYKAMLHEKLAHFDDMFESLKACLLMNPQSEGVLQKILFCVEISQKYEESVQFHQDFIDRNPESYLAWYNLGQAYYCLDNYENAADAFEYAFLMHRSFVAAYKDFAIACFKYKDYDRALKGYESSLNHIEPDAEIFACIGECYEHKKDYEIASVFYLKAKSLDSTYSYTYYRMGECYAKQKAWDSAIKAYHEAISVEKNREEYHAALGEAYFQVGEDERALPCFQKAADIAPDTPIYWLQFATFLMDTGAYDDAIEVLEEAKMYTVGVELEYCEAACCLLLGKRKEAKKLLMSALSAAYDKHLLLFKLVPNMGKDSDIISLINMCHSN